MDFLDLLSLSGECKTQMRFYKSVSCKGYFPAGSSYNGVCLVCGCSGGFSSCSPGVMNEALFLCVRQAFIAWIKYRY
jgi:hypothetical protein